MFHWVRIRSRPATRLTQISPALGLIGPGACDRQPRTLRIVLVHGGETAQLRNWGCGNSSTRSGPWPQRLWWRVGARALKAAYRCCAGPRQGGDGLLQPVTVAIPPDHGRGVPSIRAVAMVSEFKLLRPPSERRPHWPVPLVEKLQPGGNAVDAVALDPRGFQRGCPHSRSTRSDGAASSVSIASIAGAIVRHTSHQSA